MYWTDEGYLLAKTNFDENSIIVESFTLNHGKCTGIIYGGSSLIGNAIIAGIILNFTRKDNIRDFKNE